MKTTQFSFQVTTAYGNPLPKPISVSGSFEELESYQEIPAKEIPDNDEVLKYVNNKRKAAARASETNDALTKAGIERPTAKDDNVAVREMAKVFKARGDSEEVATQKARAALGL